MCIDRIRAAVVATALLLAGPAVVVAEDYPAPPIAAGPWLNSEPLHMDDLRGRVVLVEFWTRGCSNCQNVEPHIKAWHTRYGDKGLVVIGVHAPEFTCERDIGKLRSYLREHGIDYPVAVDNDFTTWHAWRNHYWPALYLVDKEGLVRYRRIGEGGYARSEAMIRKLLAE